MVLVTIIMVALVLLLELELQIVISVIVLIATVKVNVTNVITIMMDGEKHQNQMVAHLKLITTMQDLLV